MTAWRAPAAQRDPVAATEAVRLAEAAVKAATEARDHLLAELVLDEGWTHEVAAAAFEVSRQRVGQLVQRVRKQRASELGKMPTPAERLRDAREAYRLALHAQDLRCEAETGMNAREVRAFYGHMNESAADVVEQRVRFAGFHETDAAARIRCEEEVA